MRTTVALIAGLLLATPALAMPIANPFNDRMKALSLDNRNGALRRAVTLDNQRCGRLAPSVYRGMYGNLGYWQARCTPGGDYAVFVGPDGEVQVRACGNMNALGLPGCTAMASDRIAKRAKR